MGLRAVNGEFLVKGLTYWRAFGFLGSANKILSNFSPCAWVGPLSIPPESHLSIAFLYRILTSRHALASVCSIETNWGVIVQDPFSLCVISLAKVSYHLHIYNWILLHVFKLTFLSRFLLPVKSLVPSQMYSVHSAWMHEVSSHLYSVSLLNVSSKFFCLQITSQPCGGGGVLIPLVSHQDVS